MVNNLDWTDGAVGASTSCATSASTSRSTRCSPRESVRPGSSQDGISYTEFSYQILQANDFLELYRRYGCTLQIGGSDQWGNLTAGVDLIRRVTGDTVHALATPLITKADGTKYGKTEGGAIWLDPELMTPVRLLPVLAERADDRDARRCSGSSRSGPARRSRSWSRQPAERPAARDRPSGRWPRS